MPACFMPGTSEMKVPAASNFTCNYKERNADVKIRKLALMIFLLLFFGIASSAFWFSSKNVVESRRMSMAVTEKILNAGIKIGIMPAEALELRNIRKYDNMVRKIAHFVLYVFAGFFGAGSAYFWRMVKNMPQKWNWYVFVLFLCIILAVFDELHQKFVPGRGPMLKDVLIDTAGSSIGITIWLIVLCIVKKANKKTYNFDKAHI